MQISPLSSAAGLLALALMSAPANANDSMAEIAIGGLALTTTEEISLDSEDLFISRDLVKVSYRFTNSGTKDIETLVAFPLPDQSNGEEQPLYDFASQLAFETTVDGVKADLTLVEQAFFNKTDVTDVLKQAGLQPSSSADWETWNTLMAGLPEAQRKALLDQGLVEDIGIEGQHAYQARWSVRTTVTRNQVFPAGKTVAVEHRYKPIAGGSVGGALNPEFRNEDWQKEHSRKYCVEDSWFSAFDKALAQRATADNPSPYSEWWLGYVLKSGANWKGPIRDFRLVIDKGKPDSLVSFCAEGVKKISPTQFEVKKSNFEPSEDLNILIVEWYDGQGG